MKKLSVLLCGIGLSCFLTGCGNTMIELTEEENDLITEYAVSLLLKYDRNTSSRLIDLAEYEEERAIIEENAEAVKEAEALEAEAAEENEPAASTEVIDNTEVTTASTIEDFYGIDGFSFQYAGYDLKTEYPDLSEEGADAFFAMEATPGMQLMIVKFRVTNLYGTELNMMNYNTKMRVSVNGESSRSVLSTLLLNDIQTYNGFPEADTELVAIVEVPEGTYVETLSLILRDGSDSVSLALQ